MTTLPLNISPDPLDYVALIAKDAPRHVQIRENLRQQIHTGTYQPGDRIPSEEELANTWNVSRLTARRSVSDLVNEGLLKRRPGIGTFITGKKRPRDISALVSFWESTKAVGMEPKAKLIKQERIAATPEIADSLEMKEKDPVYRICRIRLADGVVMAYHIAHIPAHLFPGLLKKNLEKLSLYALYRSTGYAPYSGEQSIKAVAADADIADLLAVPVGSPVLGLERITRSNNGRPVEFLLAYYRSDRHVIQMPLQLSGDLGEIDDGNERG